MSVTGMCQNEDKQGESDYRLLERGKNVNRFDGICPWFALVSRYESTPISAQQLGLNKIDAKAVVGNRNARNVLAEHQGSSETA